MQNIGILLGPTKSVIIGELLL